MPTGAYPCNQAVNPCTLTLLRQAPLRKIAAGASMSFHLTITVSNSFCVNVTTSRPLRSQPHPHNQIHSTPRLLKEHVWNTLKADWPQLQMFSRAAVRATTKVAGRRGFHATRSQMSSPYHYPEGPYTNIPFNPKAKTFPLLFWGFCAGGFGAPFLIASALYGTFTLAKAWSLVLILFPI